MPTDEIIKEKFSEYVTALGKVAHAWNSLQERLGQLFIRAVPTAPHNVLLAVWYSEPSDRAQRRMLRAAINAGALDGWPYELPEKAKDDVLWLLEEAEKLSNRRDQTIHAPCCLTTDAQGTQITAAFYHGNPLAKKLQGKKLLEEFAISEWRAEQLSRNAQQIENALHRHTSPWPDKRPSLDPALRRRTQE